ncbi:CsbD family protein [Micromonospora sp. DT44]|uniref:CsbD family protein n=1 Tax=Micromonospora sp. DT44 TaxID=3393439 RepID=UPI003CF60194
MAPPPMEDTRGIDDKIGNASEEAAGKLKEGAGKAADDEQLEAEGRGNQASANMKQAGEKVKDTFTS